MIKRKKIVELDKIEIPTVFQTKKMIDDIKVAEELYLEVLGEKVKEAVNYICDRYRPYLEMFYMQNMVVGVNGEFFDISKNMVRYDGFNVYGIDKAYKVRFLKKIDTIVELADKRIISIFEEKQQSNKEMLEEIKYIKDLKFEGTNVVELPKDEEVD